MCWEKTIWLQAVILPIYLIETNQSKSVNVSITLNITQADVLAAQRLHWKSNRNKLSIIVSYVLTLIPAFYCYTQNQWVLACLWLIVPRIWLAVFWWVVLPRQARQQYLRQIHLHQPQTLSWDTHSLTFRTVHRSGKIGWGELVKYRENHNIVLLYVTDNLFQILPKRCFDSEAALASFRQHVAPITVSV